MLGTVLLCFAFVFAVFAAASWPSSDASVPWRQRIHLGWLALAFYIAASLFWGYSRYLP